MVALVGLALTACGTAGSPGAQAPSASTSEGIGLLPKDENIAALVPKAIRDKGKLVFATEAASPPNQFFDSDGKTIIGNEVEFGEQLASLMGLEVEWVNMSFDAILPGLQAGRYDAALSGVRDTKEREQVLDFVSYAAVGFQIFAKKENAGGPSTLEELCGRTVGLLSGSTIVASIVPYSEKCTTDGRKEIAVSVFKTEADLIQAVLSGQMQFGIQGEVTNAYVTQKTDGALIGIGPSFMRSEVGIPMPKDSGLKDAMYMAVRKLLSSPQYMAILKKWNITGQAISEPKLNGASS